MNTIYNIFAPFRQRKESVKMKKPKLRYRRKIGYDYLHEMCKNVRNEASAYGNGRGGMTERACYIIEQLNNIEVDYKIIPFDGDNVETVVYGKGKLINIQTFFPATEETNKTIIYTAHHDIANSDSENCQDNTASVCNLIHLCQEIKRLKHRNRNVYIVFTDCEEIGGRGATKMCSQITNGEYGEVEAVISLELTAGGSEMWAEGGLPIESPIMRKFLTLAGVRGRKLTSPYNENKTIRATGLDGFCVGILPKEEMRSGLAKIRAGFAVLYSAFPTWNLCHSKDDTFEKSANRQDMTRLVYFLKRFINE